MLHTAIKVLGNAVEHDPSVRGSTCFNNCQARPTVQS